MPEANSADLVSSVEYGTRGLALVGLARLRVVYAVFCLQAHDALSRQKGTEAKGPDPFPTVSSFEGKQSSRVVQLQNEAIQS